MRLLHLFLLPALSAPVAFSQTATPAKKPAATSAAKTTTGATKPATAAARTVPGACVKTPELSSKIPALPAGAPCAKALYTITSVPSVKLDYVSTVAGPDIAETLGITGPLSFSLQYIDTQVGTGPVAAPHQWYNIHYTGYLLDGTKFDSSVDRGQPISIHYGEHQVIPGWDTGFGGMRVGGKRRLFIPYQLAYGTTAHGPIPAKSELVFDVELVSVSDTQPAPPTPPTPPAGATAPAGARPMPLGARPAAPGAAPTGAPATAPAASAPTATPAAAAAAPAAAPANPAKP